MIDGILKFLAIAPPVVIALMGVRTVKPHGFHRDSTVSAIAARGDKTSRELALAIAICSPLYYFAMYLLIAPKFHLPFTAFFWVITLLGAFAMAYWPADIYRKRSYWIHTIAGLVLSVIMFIFALLIALSADASTTVSIAAWFYIELVVLAGILMLLFRRVRREKLALEVTFTAGFYILIAIAALF